jgi:RNA polymerase sigma-70 factor (sigma-E family)
VDDLEAAQFREYVSARQGALFRTALLLTGHRQDAEDLLQAALTKLAQRWQAVHRAGTPDAYLRTTMYHQWISWTRRHRHDREYTVATAPEPPATDDIAADGALRVALAKVLSQLTAKQRAIVVLRYYEDLPESEVAHILRCSLGTVRSQAHRTLARLRELCPELAPEKEFDTA